MKRKLKDINIPIKMKVQNVTKEVVINKEKHSWEKNDARFHGDIYLEVFGQKLNIGDVMMDPDFYGGHKTISDVKEAIRRRFLAHMRTFKMDTIR